MFHVLKLIPHKWICLSFLSHENFHADDFCLLCVFNLHFPYLFLMCIFLLRQRHLIHQVQRNSGLLSFDFLKHFIFQSSCWFLHFKYVSVIGSNGNANIIVGSRLIENSQEMSVQKFYKAKYIIILKVMPPIYLYGIYNKCTEHNNTAWQSKFSATKHYFSTQ